MKKLFVLKEILLDLFFPPKCGICGKIGTDICEECYQKLQQYQIKFNYKMDKKCELDRCFAYKYDDIVRRLLIDYKFNDKSYLYKLFSKSIIKNKKIYNFIKSYDIIIPVPLHKKRILERGYNQVELVSKEIANIINSKQNKKIYINTNILKKNKNTKPQSSKNYKQRIEGIKGVYFVENEEQIYNKKVLIFDDVYTTGATCNECKKVLLQAGAKKVGVFTIARDFLKR